MDIYNDEKQMKETVTCKDRTYGNIKKTVQHLLFLGVHNKHCILLLFILLRYSFVLKIEEITLDSKHT